MSRRFDDLSATFLRVLTEAIGDYAVIGSFARDYRVHTVAGLERPAQTLDVDVAVLVDSWEDYRARLGDLEGPLGIGIVFTVEGLQVDVIPFGRGIASDGILEVQDGVTLDVTGMRDAFDAAESVPSPAGPVRIPPLASMIGLKVVAWDYRRDTTLKDARDLEALCRATFHGPDLELLWADEVAGQRWDYQPELMGTYRAGLELARTWSPGARRRLVNVLGAGRQLLASDIVRQQRMVGVPVQDWDGMLDSLRAGLLEG